MISVSAMELDFVAPESSVDVRVSGNEGSVEVRVGDFMESDGGGVDDKMEIRVGEVNREGVSHRLDDDRDDEFEVHGVGFDDQDDLLDAHDEQFDGLNGMEHMPQRTEKLVEVDKRVVSPYNNLLTEFDDYVANEKNMVMGTSHALSYGFDIGDMVWGKVKSHPWWPGHIFNEAFAYSSSTRRMRRNGNVLVAFFGDSSYGWFDPAELIPFDPNFAEKSRQTNSKTFVKAVEEAMDEGSRRRGLGLACKCRNPYNFRPTSIQGYYAVDVPDYEPGSIYSASQIKKARDSFNPGETLSFIKQLAMKPRASEQISIDFVKNKATVCAYRKAVFEEFDETYGQAFAVLPPLSSQDHVDISNQSIKEPPRAPLSGPLVIAEPLGGKKSSKKSMKFKDQSKKDQYLFKRREETYDSKIHQISQGKASSSAPATYVEGSTAVGDYVLQKRAPSVSEQSVSISMDGPGSSQNVSGKEAVTREQAPAYSSTTIMHATATDANLSLVKEKGVLQGLSSDVVLGPTNIGRSDLSGKVVFPSLTAGVSQSFQQEDLNNVEDAKLSGSYEGLQQQVLTVSTNEERGHGLDQGQVGLGSTLPSPKHVKLPGAMKTEGGVKKVKLLKRPMKDLSAESSIAGVKKKKIKREASSEMSSDHQKKYLATGQQKLEGQKEFDSTSNNLSASVGTSRMASVGTIELELPQLLSDLQALALNPYHGVEKNIPVIVKKFFLRFRSLVYQKSLVSAPLASESDEFYATKPSVHVGASDNPHGETVRDLPSKPVRPVGRPSDPTKAGRKHLQSDRQEEIAAKRLKKITDMKALTAEKKAILKTPETQRGEGKLTATTPAPTKYLKTESLRKVEPPAKTVDPTMLVMKFPPQTSLPSVAELKARFARFGQLDYSAIRVFWKSSTCRVVYLHKLDAQAALKYALGTNSLFGNVSVRYYIREVAAPDGQDPTNAKVDDTPYDSPQMKDLPIDRPTSTFLHQFIQQPATQLKSILKKPPGDDATAAQVTGNAGRAIPRVKFMLGEEDTSGNRNNFNKNASFADAAAPSSNAMEFNSTNFQKVISPSPLPNLPIAQKFSINPHNNSPQISELVRFAQNIPTAPPPSAKTIDISKQMLSLLTRCNDVVTNLTSVLGYVPYHPL